MISPRHLLAACLGAALLTACPGEDPVPIETDSDTTSTGDPPATTLPMTDPATSVSSVDTTVTPDDTSTTDDPDTTGTTEVDPDTTGTTGTTDDTGTTGTTGDTGTTGTTGTTGEGSTTTGGMMNPEGYGDCTVDASACLAQEVCVVDAPMAPTIAVCTDLDCAAADDCPSSPPGGTADVVCTDVTGDMVNDCILDCSMGETCPTGMTCFAGFLCAWPAVPPVPEGYGDCGTDPTACLADELCVVDNPAAPTISVCADLDCVNAGACPASPPGGTAPVACTDVTGDMVNDCILDCSMGGTCPTGMNCFAGLLCAWPTAPAPAPEGFGDCAADPTACLANEVCVSDNPAAPTVSVCADIDCGLAAECPASPPGGTAPVTCADVTGDTIGDCFLDCSAGQACPTGMTCFAGFICAWPV